MTFPRRTAGRVLLVMAVVLAAWVVWSLSTLPARTVRTPAHAASPGRPTARGVYHVHSRGSDGTGKVAEIAAAASRAGLVFVILTDHQDGSRPHPAPQYVGGVLVVDASEISAAPGHLVALGMTQAPYPLAGEERDLLEDVHRLGGFGIAAHPDSAREDLRWTDWSLPIDGLEWFNADSQWRAEPWLPLARAVLQYPLRSAETVSSLFTRPSGALAQWDKLTEVSRVVGMAASDAHARIGIGGGSDPYQGGIAVPLPTYESVFRAMSLTVDLDAPFAGDAPADASRLLAAIRAGHLHTVIDGYRTPGWLSFEGRSGTAIAREGDILPVLGDVILRAECDMPRGSAMTLFRNGHAIRTTGDPVLEWRITGNGSDPPADGTFRIELTLAGHTEPRAAPWIVSNPIYVGLAEPASSPAPQEAAPGSVERYGLGTEWKIERDSRSTGSVESAEDGGLVERSFQFRLGEGVSPFVAAVTPEIDALRRAARIRFTGRADQPVRVSVQMRAPSAREGERWQRSIYLDAHPRDVAIPLAEFRSVGAAEGPGVRLDRIDTLLFVIDTTNSRPGRTGTIWLRDLRVER